MNYFKKCSAILILVFLMSATQAFAHAGGHGHDKQTLHKWTNIETGITIHASFLTVQDDKVLLENHAGKIVGIPLSQLSVANKEYVAKRQTLINQLNKEQHTHTGILSNGTQTGIVVVILICIVLVFLYKQNWLQKKQLSLSIVAIAALTFIYAACKKDEGVTATTPTTTPTATGAAAIINKAFAFFSDKVTTRSDDNYFYVESQGIPSHNMMVGITNWQQQVPIPQLYTGSNPWSIPLSPEKASTPISTKDNFLRGAIGIAVNGIPIFNAYNNRGEDANIIGELDNWGGHCGKADDYHYHTAPLHLQSTVGNQTPIAYALDGYAVYGTTEPDGSAMTSLDAYNGHDGTDGVYHYHGTSSYPYMIGAMVGKVTIANEQIEPQAASQGVRPALTPLNGASITGFSSTGTNAYSLEYTLSSQKYYINYNWTEAGAFTFEFIDPQGGKTTENYQR